MRTTHSPMLHPLRLPPSRITLLVLYLLFLTGCGGGDGDDDDDHSPDTAYTAFAATPRYSTGQTPMDLLSIDVDGDGAMDLITADADDDTVSLLRKRGDGTFAPPLAFQVGDDPASLRSADLNQDGQPDLLVENTASEGWSILLNDGAGGFRAERRLSAPAPIRAVALGDMNNDGLLDLVGAGEDFSVRVWLNEVGEFRLAGRFATVSRSPSLALADLNGDGNLDVLSGGWSEDLNPDFSPELSHRPATLLFGAGDGTLDDARAFPAVAVSGFLAIRVEHGLIDDLDGDDRPDIVLGISNYGVPEGNSLRLDWYRNRGDGTFDPSREIIQWLGRASVNLTDLDADGSSDLWGITNDGDESCGLDARFFVAHNRGGEFRLTETPIASSLADDPILQDLDGDARLDLVGYSPTGDDLWVIPDILGAEPGRPRRWVSVSSPSALVVEDFNGDGTPDLAAISPDEHAAQVLLNDGAGHFPGPFRHTLQRHLGALPARVDYALLSTTPGSSTDLVSRLQLEFARCTGTLSLRLQDQPLTIWRELQSLEPDIIEVPGSRSDSDEWSFQLVGTDLDGDGRTDLLIQRQNTLERWLGNDTGGFTRLPDLPIVFDPPRSIPYAGDLVPADLDGDGDRDLLARFGGREGRLLRWYGNGAGNLTQSGQWAVESRTALPLDATAGGRAALLLFLADGTLERWDPDGETDYRRRVLLRLDSNTRDLQTLDWDGDGIVDLLGLAPVGEDAAIRAVWWWQGNPDGGFSGARTLTDALAASNLTVGDANSDGLADLILNDEDSGLLWLYFRQGDGTLASEVSRFVGAAPARVDLQDMNDDGRVDLLIGGDSGRDTGAPLTVWPQ